MIAVLIGTFRTISARHTGITVRGPGGALPMGHASNRKHEVEGVDFLKYLAYHEETIGFRELELVEWSPRSSTRSVE